LELGCVSAIDSNGRTIWIADAHRDNGKRFVVHADLYPPFDSANLDVVRADEMLTTFLELEAAIRVAWREMKF
jgi:hypothetical protein